MTRTATAVRQGRFWLVEVPGIGVTQGRTIREARAMAHDLVRDLVVERRMTKADVAVLLQVSQQRVSQLLP